MDELTLTGRKANFYYECATDESECAIFCLESFNNNIMCGTSSGSIYLLRFDSDVIDFSNIDKKTEFLVLEHVWSNLHAESVSRIKFLSKFKTIFSGDLKGSLKRINYLSKNVEIHYDDCETDIECLNFDESQEFLVVGCLDGSCWIYHLEKGLVNCYNYHNTRILLSDFVEINNKLHLITFSIDGLFTLTHLENSKVCSKFNFINQKKYQNEFIITAVSVSKAQSIASIGTTDGKFILVNYITLRKIFEFVFPLDKIITEIAINEKITNLVALSHENNCISIFDNCRLRHEITVELREDYTISHLLWNNFYLIVGTNQNEILIYDSRNCSLYDSLVVTDTINDLILDEINEKIILIAGCEDSTVHLWYL